MRFGSRSGQAASEFAVLYAAVVLPLTFIIVFVAEMFWVWHSVVEFTRDGARYAATHCWLPDGSAGNVIAYMNSHVPRMIDMDQFGAGGQALIQVQYLQENPDGSASAFASDDSGRQPDAVAVGVSNYQFMRFSAFMKLPPVTIPPFTTNVPMESGGYQDASGTCVP